MPDISFTNLLVVAAVAVLAPLTVGFAPRLRVPAVVLEIVGGIIIGPAGFGWVHVDLPVQILALVVPVLKDAGQVHSEMGQTALAAASIADFAAIVLLSLFFSSSGGSTGARVVVPCWPSGSAWNPFWAPSWPGPSSAW